MHRFISIEQTCNRTLFLLIFPKIWIRKTKNRQGRPNSEQTNFLGKSEMAVDIILLKIARITNATVSNFIINGQYEPPTTNTSSKFFRFLSIDKVSLFTGNSNVSLFFSLHKFYLLFCFDYWRWFFILFYFLYIFLLHIIQFVSRSVSHLSTYSHQIDKIQYVFTAIQFHFVMFLFSHFQYYVYALVLLTTSHSRT